MNVAKLLIDHQADVSAKDHWDRTPLIFAAENGNQLIHFLWRMENNFDFLRLGHFDVAKLLLDRGADVNEKDEDNQTPLIKATQNGNLLIQKTCSTPQYDLYEIDNCRSWEHNSFTIGTWSKKFSMKQLMIILLRKVGKFQMHSQSYHFSQQQQKSK